jgi:hypothetical protein
VREQRVIHIRTFELGRLFTEPVFEGVKVAHFAQEGACAGGGSERSERERRVVVSIEWANERETEGVKCRANEKRTRSVKSSAERTRKEQGASGDTLRNPRERS